MPSTIKDKVIVITGASSGLGEATARLLAEQGAKLVIGARREDRLQAIVHYITRRGGAAIGTVTDVTQRAQVEHLVQLAVNTFGRIDVMVNNAGLMPLSPLPMLKVEDWDQMIDVNIKGVLYGVAAALPHMQQQRSGHFINVSSVAGHKVHAGGAVYSATKFAVRALSEGLRQEVKPWNIRTTVLLPGAVDTELAQSITVPEIAAGVQQFYRNTAIPAEAFAELVAFAISQPEAVDINEILFRPTSQEL